MKEQDPPQPPGRRIIERPRLLNQLEQTEARTILLIAPAGYGKTTLLRQWATRNPVCWFTAGPGSSDLAQLATGLATALEGLSSGLCDEVSQVVAALSNPPRQLRELVEAFRSRLADSPPETLVIDDYHLLAATASTETFVQELFDQLHVRLLVASRSRPLWATARAEIYGEVLEIGPEELALTPDETADVLIDAPGTLSGKLLTQANGWPAVIGLAAITRSPRRTPDSTVSATLFRFLAEELFTAAPETLQEQLLTMALLPVLSLELMNARFGDLGESVLADAVNHGFATLSDQQHELHPLIREYLLSKLSHQADANERVNDSVALSLRVEAWDNAFTLITHFGRADLLEDFLESAFMALTRSGRIGTLEQVRDFARTRSADFSPTVALIDAELALRDGLFLRAEALAARVAEGLGSTHVLAAHAHWVAGQGAQLSASFALAPKHFRRSRATAKNDDDARDALWGLMVTSIYSEAFAASEAADELQRRRDASPIDLLLATNAAMLRRRYSNGFAEPFDTESALHSLDAVRDPRVRTSFTYSLSYEWFLRAEYNRAIQLAKMTVADASNYQLSWVIPQAEWILAAASLGCRDLGNAERWLRRAERAAGKLDIPLLRLNAAALRARFLLALQRPEQAHDVLLVDDSDPVNPAMRAELGAMRALALALLGEVKEAEIEADKAAAMTTSVEIRAYVACAHAICRPTAKNAVNAFGVAERFGVWDPLVSTMRAYPALLERLAKGTARQAPLKTLLRRSNDFDLARRVALSVGPRPRTPRSALSPREREVLELVRQGLTNKKIGEILFISHGTAKVHVRHILDKMGARTRTEAATRAVDSD